MTTASKIFRTGRILIVHHFRNPVFVPSIRVRYSVTNMIDDQYSYISLDFVSQHTLGLDGIE